MKPSAWVSRWVPAASVAAVSLVALGTATFGAHAPAPPAARAAADAPAQVVRTQPSAAHPDGPCRTCELGAAGSSR